MGRGEWRHTRGGNLLGTREDDAVEFLPSVFLGLVGFGTGANLLLLFVCDHVVDGVLSDFAWVVEPLVLL